MSGVSERIISTGDVSSDVGLRRASSRKASWALLRKIFNAKQLQFILMKSGSELSWGGEACVYLVHLCSQFYMDADWRIMVLKAWKPIKRVLIGNSVVPRV